MWSRVQRGRAMSGTGGEHAAAAASTVFIVSGERGAQQVFTDRAAAHSYAEDVPGSRVSVHRLRRSLDEAVVVLDRHVVLTADGQTSADRTVRLRHFVDDDVAPSFALAVPDADVEWFYDDRADEWHIAGFGTDERRLAASIQDAVQRVRRQDTRLHA